MTIIKSSRKLNHIDTTRKHRIKTKKKKTKSIIERRSTSIKVVNIQERIKNRLLNLNWESNMK